MVDKAHEKTDEKIEAIEKHLSAIYSKANKEIQQTADDYFKKFKKEDKIKREKLQKGEITADEYKRWQQGKVAYGKRYKEMQEQVTQQLYHVNQTATAYINGQLPEVYALNYNSLADTVDGVGGYSFTLTDADTVKNLATSDSSFLPYREIDEKKDTRWNMKKINSEVLQGIIQGESVDKISKRIGKVQKMNKEASVRSARTIVTGAENKGRQDSYLRAEKDGIQMKREWISANDKRTRKWHAELDGVVVGLHEPWENAVGKIMFPGDPTADGANVYNCRCTMAVEVVGFKGD